MSSISGSNYPFLLFLKAGIKTFEFFWVLYLSLYASDFEILMSTTKKFQIFDALKKKKHVLKKDFFFNILSFNFVLD